MFYYRVTLTVQILFLPVLILLTALFSSRGRNVDVGVEREVSRRAVCPSVSDSVVAVRVVGHSSFNFDSAKMALATMLNPMSGIIEGYRAALFGLPFDWPALGIASALTIRGPALRDLCFRTRGTQLRRYYLA